MSPRRGAFLDRDGVLCEAPIVDGIPRSPHSVESLRVLPGVADACRRLHEAGWTLVMVTNQPDIARGGATREVVDAVNAAIAEQVHLDEIVVCPHDDVDACDCRKPKAGMILGAAERLDIDLAASVMVGDRWRDVEAGRAAGVRTFFVDHGYGEKEVEADHTVNGLPEAADIILAIDGAEQRPSDGGHGGPQSGNLEESAGGRGPLRGARRTSVRSATDGAERAIDTDDWEGHWATYADTASDNPAQVYRHRLVTKALRRKGAPERLVDIGSGQGDLIRMLSDELPDTEMLGLELSAEGIRHASAKAPKARFLQRNLLEDDEVPTELVGWGTTAVCSEVLEHVDDPALLLRNALVFLRPGARVVVTVPGGPRTAFDRHIGHRRHYDRASIRKVLVDAGLHVESVSAAGFPFFNLYKLAVLARGEALVEDFGSDRPPSRVGSLAMKVFGVLFRGNLTSTPFGWQLLAVARVPRNTAPNRPLPPGGRARRTTSEETA